MKKFLVVLMMSAVVLTFCAAARAMVLKVDSFAVYGISIDLPNGWALTTDENDIFITSIDGSASLTLVYAHREGWNGPQFANFIASNLEGSDPVENEEGYFEFTFTENDAKINVRTMHVHNMGIVMKSGSGFDGLIAILNTLIYGLY